jgi:hypothetical protein
MKIEGKDDSVTGKEKRGQRVYAYIINKGGGPDNGLNFT